MFNPDEIVKALYSRHGMVVDRDDPVVLAALIYDIALSQHREDQEASREAFAMAMDELLTRVQAEGQAAGQQQFTTAGEALLTRMSASGEQVCKRMAAAGQTLNEKIEATAARLTDDREEDELGIIIANTYALMKGAFLCLASLLLLGGIGLIGKVLGWY